MKRSFRTGCVFVAFFLAAVSQAQTFVFTAFMDGPSEFPPNASPGTGFTTITMDSLLYTMRVEANFQDLIGNTTAAHIHGPTVDPFAGTAGVITQLPSFSGFPTGVTSGSYDNTFDMTQPASWNPAFLSTHGDQPIVAFFALLQHMDDGKAYFNIHSTQFPGGEIRGFLVPEPGTMAALGLGALVLLRRRRRAV